MRSSPQAAGCAYLVITADLSGEHRQVVETKGHIIVHVLIQALIGWARVTTETQIQQS